MFEVIEVAQRRSMCQKLGINLYIFFKQTFLPVFNRPGIQYREFSPYANFITANFVTAVFQDYV